MNSWYHHFSAVVTEIRQWFARHCAVILFIFSLLLAGGLHGYNMFYYPYFESDEGTYLSQAFAVREFGELSLYTYWYDHPPFGWITLAAWIDLLQGNWNAFGHSLNTGRVFMWVLHLIQVSIIFFIVRRVTTSAWLAFFAVVLYSTSPLATYFQRRVLLDNLLTTWVLLATAVLFVRQVRLRHVILSGLFFGLAMVTKITTVMFGPAFAYLLLTASWPLHKGLRFLTWCLVAGSIFSLWFIYAAINTELLPDPHGERVSLVGAILFQAERGTGAHFWEAESSFRDNLTNWVILDETFVYLVAIGLVCTLLITVFRARYRFFGMAALLYFVFLIRGGVVIGFYVLPMLPFVAMSTVMGVAAGVQSIRRRGVPEALIILVTVVMCGVYSYHYYPKITKYLTVDETSNQIEAIRWVKQNLPADTRIIVDIYGMTELLNPHFENERVFENAEWYFKVAKDPMIRFDKYRDDWRNFDYVLISHEMIFQSSLNTMPIVYDAIRNSEPVRRWDANSTAFVDIQRFISTNGDWVALHRINNNTRTQLLYAWNHFRANFIESYGQVVDPQTNTTTSEGQSYAMLRAVYMNDPEMFKGVWLWTQHHLQHRLDDNLISWQWRDGQQIDSANATDADLDIALALIFASQRFAEPAYLVDAQALLDSIWEETVVSINGRYYLLPMERSLARRNNYFLLNPSYFSPAHYRIFAEVDPMRREQWLQLAADTYFILGDTLPTNWVLVDDTTGAVSSAASFIAQGNADVFSYDASRTFWRVGLDVEWFGTPAATRYLEQMSQTFVADWGRNGLFVDAYAISGTRLSAQPNLAVTAGILSALRFGASPSVAAEVYAEVFGSALVIDEDAEIAYWGNPTNYYNANWVWFGHALYNGNLPNLWQLHRLSE